MSDKLAIYPGSKPIHQKHKKLRPERSQVVEEQKKALLEAGFIREVKYPSWLANMVLIKKQNGKWRMCIDYIDLNKACSKDPYPLPSIVALVDSALGYRLSKKNAAMAVELSEFDLKYKARTTIKSEHLVDFIAEYTESRGSPTTWSLYVDGSSNKVSSGVGVILENEQGTRIELSLRFEFPASNNQAEYETLLAGLKLAKVVGAES
nr:uncharacterized protein LOC112795071 [Arachis hypogaea]